MIEDLDFTIKSEAKNLREFSNDIFNKTSGSLTRGEVSPNLESSAKKGSPR